MIYKLEWVHPSMKRRITRRGMNGETLQQEVTSQQSRETLVVCATLQEYIEHVREEEVSDYTNELQIQAAHTIHEGIASFTISSTGSREILPTESDDGSYTYTQGT
jgi:hypothetical protein